MNDSTAAAPVPAPGFGVADGLAVALGLLVFGYGLLLVPESALGGAWVAAIGLSLALAGLFAAEWVGDLVGLSPTGRRRLSLAFGLVAATLFVAVVVANGATFVGGSETGGTGSLVAAVR